MRPSGPKTGKRDGCEVFTFRQSEIVAATLDWNSVPTSPERKAPVRLALQDAAGDHKHKYCCHGPSEPLVPQHLRHHPHLITRWFRRQRPVPCPAELRGIDYEVKIFASA